MANPSSLLNESRIEALKTWTGIVSNIAVIIGVILLIIQIAYLSWQINQTNTIESRRIAIEAINQTRASEFLKAYTNLKTAYTSKQVADKPSLIEDVNYVFNVYDSIALLYINDLADRCIIKQSVYSAIEELIPVLEMMNYPPEYRRTLDTMLVMMRKESCN